MRKSNYKNRIGFDSDLNVVRAAKVFNIGKDIEFEYGSFSEARSIKDIDVLVAINWVHNLNSDLLIKELLSFPKILIITEGVSNYKYFHSEEVFSSDFKILSKRVVGQRHIFLIQKT